MGRLLLLINTIKYLKWQQIYFRLLRKFFKPKVTDKFSGSIPERSDAWEHFTLYEEKIDKYQNACFLNESKELNFPDDWNSKGPSKLWLYNLHYFEDLLSSNANEKRDFHRHLLNRWVDENPVGQGNGWEPYPTSLRIVNILKAWLGGLELDYKLFKSVYFQASYLSNDLEKHLLGNHYFVNLKALLFAGVIYENFRWIKTAEKGLLAEIPEQILGDGANFELSPMYHSLILVDMLDMFNLSMAYPAHFSRPVASLLEEYIPKMLKFMQAMAHPDGGVSFFNDSVDGIAPQKVKIESYARKLQFIISPSPSPSGNLQIFDNPNSGYISVIAADNKLIFDAASVGPDYIPAHAHADTLSFELSIGKTRVFVNSGTSEYGVSKSRNNQRETKSHNTVVIDDKNSSEVWGGFRVANRAYVTRRSSELLPNNRISLYGEHDGYKKMFRGCIHSRKLTFSKNNLIINDSISGIFRTAKAYFYFHPDLNLFLEENILSVKGASFLMQSELTGLAFSLSDSTWHPEFGAVEKNKVLCIEFNKRELEVCFFWNSFC